MGNLISADTTSYHNWLMQDAPDAKALTISQPPYLDFDNVTFAFVPGSPVLKNGRCQDADFSLPHKEPALA